MGSVSLGYRPFREKSADLEEIKKKSVGKMVVSIKRLFMRNKGKKLCKDWFAWSQSSA